MKKILTLIAFIILFAVNVNAQTNTVAVMETTMGTIKIKLFTDKAPNTSQNFIDLVNKGFYDGLTFHRVIDQFMIQGGDPTGTGMGGSDKITPDEFNTGLSHGKAGMVSMANAGPNTSTSQFFITITPQQRLDGGYSVFGEVIEGIEVVNAIGKVKTGPMDKPIEDVQMTKVTISEE